MKANRIKLFLFLVLNGFLWNNSFSQPADSYFMFHFEGTDKRFMVRQPYIHQFQENNLEWVFNVLNPEFGGININNEPRSPILLGVQLNTELSNYYGPDIEVYTKRYASYIISDSTDAKIIALGIHPDNVHEYHYRVVENDSLELIPWSPVPDLVSNYGTKKPVADLGSYNSPGNQVMVEVKKIDDYSVRDGIIFDWRVNFRPVVTQILTNTPRNYFALDNAELNRNYVTEFDTETGMPVDLAFPQDSITNFRLHFEKHPTVPYQMYLTKELNGQKTSTRVDYWILDDYYDFSRKNFDQPGKYELRIQPVRTSESDKNQLLQFNFEVLPPPLKTRSFSFLQVVLYGSAVLLFFVLLFIGYYLYNRRKLVLATRQRELVGLKLKSIQNQLNPHFMFNALSSIQNLMNKNEVEGANHYLGKFSSLTRKVLDTGDQEMISLEDELKILENYLQMEQLRFNFQFIVDADPEVNLENVEIPSMLLQPFAENAVKHGVSSLNRKGNVQIEVSRQENDLLIKLTDNGPGFTPETINGNSKGISLVKKRIALLNQHYREELIKILIESGQKGTCILLTFKNWL